MGIFNVGFDKGEHGFVGRGPGGAAAAAAAAGGSAETKVSNKHSFCPFSMRENLIVGS